MAFILSDWTRLADAPWSPRRLMRAVSVGGYIYVTGGNTAFTGARVAEVWRFDGENWELLTDAPGWPARAAHGFVYYNGLFWVFGGSGQAAFLNDVWSSPDCITWTLRALSCAWSTRHEFAYCLHNGEIYLSGGYRTPTGQLNTTYKTADMINWIALGVLGLGVREHIMLSFKGNLYCYYGDPNGTSKRYVYRSINDGVNWTYLGEPVYGNRREHCGIIDEDGLNLVIIGGYDTGIPGSLNDVWETSDAFNFVQIPQINSYTARSDFCFVHHNRRLYIFGGTPDTGVTFLNDVWTSPVEPYADFSGVPRTVHLGDTVNFTNLSVGDPDHGQSVVLTMWNFGYMFPNHNTYAMTPGTDGVSHRFLMVGVFTISISVLLADSTVLTETKTAYITVLPYELDFTGTPRNGRVPLRTRFTAELVE